MWPYDFDLSSLNLNTGLCVTRDMGNLHLNWASKSLSFFNLWLAWSRRTYRQTDRIQCIMWPPIRRVANTHIYMHTHRFNGLASCILTINNHKHYPHNITVQKHNFRYYFNHTRHHKYHTTRSLHNALLESSCWFRISQSDTLQDVECNNTALLMTLIHDIH